MQNGFVKIHRQILKNPIVCKDSDYFSVWCYLLLTATHKEIKVENCGETKTLKPGQLITGCQHIGQQFGINQKKVQRILERFKNEQMIVQTTNRGKGRIITILNWAEYQDTVQTNVQTMSKECPKSVQTMSNNKNVKNIKNKKENIKEKNSHSASLAAGMGEMTDEERKKHIEMLRR